MDSKELKKIAKQMKLLGITHLKTPEFELNLDISVAPIPKAEVKTKEFTPEEQKEIEHKIEQVKALYLGSDLDLLDRLFPLPTEDSANENL